MVTGLTNSLGTANDDDGIVTCEECGLRYESLLSMITSVVPCTPWHHEVSREQLSIVEYEEDRRWTLPKDDPRLW